MTTTQQPLTEVRAPVVSFAETRKTRPVMVWAGAGVIWLGLMVYVWAKWLIDGDNTAAPVGPSPVPDWQMYSARTWEAIVAVLCVVVLWRVLIRPWRRERQLTLDGMLIIGWIVAWAVQDPLINYTRQMFNYSSVFINVGCPQCNFPGWQTPHGDKMSEPIIFMSTLYVAVLFTGSVLCCALMRKAKERWPRLGTFGLIMVAFGAMFLCDAAMEIMWLRFGLYHYGGGISWLTLFHGNYYQYPIYEGLAWGGAWAALSCMRYFRNDKGETIAERGLADVSAAPRAKQGLRLLAVIGCMSTLFLAFYNLPMQFWATHSDNFPQSVIDRSYLTNNMCGPYSDQACPGPRVPMPVGPDSGHATPQGDFIAPKGLPVQVNHGR